MHAHQLPAGSTTPEGWLAHQARANLDGFLGAMPEICPEVGSRVFSSGKLGASSETLNREAIQWWNGESEGNWLWAWSAHVRLVGTADQERAVDAWFDEIVAAAAGDGYIGMFDAAYRSTGAIPGDPWTQSRVLGALSEWVDYRRHDTHAAALDRALDEIQNRLPAEISDIFTTRDPDTMVRGHDLQLVERLVNDSATHPNLAVIAVAMYEAFNAADLSWFEHDCQLDQLMADDEDFAGHGPHTVENLRIPLLISTMLAESEPERATALVDAAKRGWTKLSRAFAMSGAVRSDETIAAEGEPSRPIPEAGQEYCAMTELVLTCLEFAKITGQMSVLDVAERVWLNAAQAARAKDGGGAAYFIADNQIEGSKQQGARWDFSPIHDDAAVCCTPNAGRILPAIVDSMVVRTTAGAAVWFYGPAHAQLEWVGHTITIHQHTQYPFSDEVVIDVSGAPAGFTLELRRPEWCGELSVEVGPDLEVTHGMHSTNVTGAWSGKDALRIVLNPEIVIETSVDGRKALTRGSLVFAVDLPVRWETTRTYGDTGLADRDAYLAPEGEASAYPPYLIATELPSIALERTEPCDDPWSRSPLHLTINGMSATPGNRTRGVGTRSPLTLVPFGATTLRHTCLPLLPR